MRTLLGTMALSACFAVAGPAFACGDIADAHDDALAQLTKPAPNATPVAKPAAETKQAGARTPEKRVATVPVKPAAVKVAARTSND